VHRGAGAVIRIEQSAPQRWQHEHDQPLVQSDSMMRNGTLAATPDRIPELLALAALVSPARFEPLEAYPGVHGVAESGGRNGVIIPMDS